MNVRVISASKKEQTLFQTATAIYVITQEDIRRSRMTSISDLLRNVTNDFKLRGAYSWITMQLRRAATSQDATAEGIERDSPRNHLLICSELNLLRQAEPDTVIFFTGERSSLSAPRHTRVESRLGWRPPERMELSLAGQNLLRPRHAEFAKTEFNPPMYDKRGVFGKAVWRF